MNGAWIGIKAILVHGFGYRENGQSVNIWTTLFYDFLDNCNLLNNK